MINYNSIAITGSFDPCSLGHFDIITRLAKYFDVMVVVAKNETKNNMFSVEERISLIQENLQIEGLYNVEVVECPDDILLVDFLKKHEIRLIARGVRESFDFIQEMTMAHINLQLSNEGIETLLFPTRQEFSHISSSAIKTIAKLGGDISSMVPDNVYDAIKEKLNV
jgi:pantetheine-phosphate adenylyltransferase